MPYLVSRSAAHRSKEASALDLQRIIEPAYSDWQQREEDIWLSITAELSGRHKRCHHMGSKGDLFNAELPQYLT